MIDDKIEIAKLFNKYFVNIKKKNQNYLQKNKLKFPQKIA